MPGTRLFLQSPFKASSARVLYCLWYHTLNIKRHISARKICRSNALVKSAINNLTINRRKFIFLVRFAFRVRYACVIRVSKISKDAKKCFISNVKHQSCFVFFLSSTCLQYSYVFYHTTKKANIMLKCTFFITPLKKLILC